MRQNRTKLHVWREAMIHWLEQTQCVCVCVGAHGGEVAGEWLSDSCRAPEEEKSKWCHFFLSLFFFYSLF